MECGDLPSTIFESLNKLWVDTPGPLPPPSLVHIVLDPDGQPDPEDSQDRQYTELKNIPFVYKETNPFMPLAAASIYGQNEDMRQAGRLCDPHNQDQSTSLYGFNIQTAAAVDQPAYMHPCDHVLVVREEVDLNQTPAGNRNEEVISPISTPSVSAPPALSTQSSQKRKHQSQRNTHQPYVKKPPNAFMLYMKEQRQFVGAQFTSQGSAVVNTLLAQRWRSMTDKEQAKYYEQARVVKMHHEQENPKWSSRDNYGQKRKRERSKALTASRMSLTKEDGHFRDLQIDVMEPRSSPKGVTVQLQKTPMVRLERIQNGRVPAVRLERLSCHMLRFYLDPA